MCITWIEVNIYKQKTVTNFTVFLSINTQAQWLPRVMRVMSFGRICSISLNTTSGFLSCLKFTFTCPEWIFCSASATKKVSRCRDSNPRSVHVALYSHRIKISSLIHSLSLHLVWWQYKNKGVDQEADLIRVYYTAYEC